MFLGRACIIFIFLNLPVPGFAEITRTTKSQNCLQISVNSKLKKGFLEISVLASTRGDLGEAKLSCKPDMKAPLTTAS